MGAYLDYFIANSENKQLLDMDDAAILYMAQGLHREYLASRDQFNFGQPFDTDFTYTICKYGARVNEEICFRADDALYQDDWVRVLSDVLPRLSAYYRVLNRQQDVFYLYNKYSIKCFNAISHEFYTSIAAAYLDLGIVAQTKIFLSCARKAYGGDSPQIINVVKRMNSGNYNNL